MSDRPTCWIIAGPNGAGKTTFALQYLPQVANCRRFVNADAIAAGLSPLAPETALLAASRLFKDLERRFPRSLRNLLNDFSQSANLTQCFMNTGLVPELVFIQQGQNREVINQKLFTQLVQQAKL
jgi:hypothetical protein